MGNPIASGGNEETKHEGMQLGTIGEEFSASHSSATFTDSRNTFQSYIVKREHISAEQYALATLFIGICSFVIAISSNLQRFFFWNFQEFYRFHESYYFVVDHIYIAITTEIILILNTWSLTFGILQAPGLMIFILMQRIQVLRYFLLAYPDINQNIFNSLKRSNLGIVGKDQQPGSSPNTNIHFPALKGAVFIPPGRFDVVLCQWVRVRHAIMKRMHRRFTEKDWQRPEWQHLALPLVRRIWVHALDSLCVLLHHAHCDRLACMHLKPDFGVQPLEAVLGRVLVHASLLRPAGRPAAHQAHAGPGQRGQEGRPVEHSDYQFCQELIAHVYFSDVGPHFYHWDLLYFVVRFEKQENRFAKKI
ncbi:ankyrin repeat protein [Cryptosporidium canis]|nr:ankyrin repeat protein [Cryptosporidium canis]